MRFIIKFILKKIEARLVELGKKELKNLSDASYVFLEILLINKIVSAESIREILFSFISWQWKYFKDFRKA